MTTLMSRGQATSHVEHSSLQLMPLLDIYMPETTIIAWVPA